MEPKIFAVVGLFIDPLTGYVLAVSRKGDPNNLGLPGGKVEPGEIPWRALHREVMEETGLEVLEMQTLYDRYYEDKVCRCYLVNTWQGKATSMEGTRVEWVPRELLSKEPCSFREFNSNLFERFRHLFGV